MGTVRCSFFTTISFGAVSFNQPQVTITLFSVFAFASLITFSSDWSSTRGPVFLVQVLLNHVLQASAAFWFILFALYLDCTGQRWSAIILNIVASVRTNVFQNVLVRRFLHREKTSLHSVSNPLNIVAPKGNVHEGSEVQKRFMSTCNTRVCSSILF